MEPATVCTTLVPIGFLEAATQAITDKQGIDSLEEIRLLSDDEISNHAKLLCCPGNPAGQVNTAGDAVPNPRIQVKVRAKTNLKLAALYLCHQDRIGRFVTPADVTLKNIRLLIRELLHDYKDTWKASDDVPMVTPRIGLTQYSNP